MISELREVTFKVPQPFEGVRNLGFYARVPAQKFNEPMQDVTFVIEGAPAPMDRLHSRLERFPQVASAQSQYIWTPPVMLSDEVCVIAFKDRSLTDQAVDDSQASFNYLYNLVQPLAFTFLRDCVRHGNLRLSEEMLVVVESAIASPRPPLKRDRAELQLRRQQIISSNGLDLLGAA